jgi:hypothetical protein
MGEMKTTVEIPDELFRRAKATAALRGASLKDVVAEALRDHLEEQMPNDSTRSGWRQVFGKASPEVVATVDAVVEEDLERIDPDDWQ